jgi:hypothetical protein
MLQVLIILMRLQRFAFKSGEKWIRYKFRQLVAENQKLRRKLEKRHHCKKCGYKRGGKKDETSHASSEGDDKNTSGFSALCSF